MQVLSRTLNGEQYVANILDQPIRIGSIFRIDDDQAILASHISDFDGKVDLAKYTSTGSKGTLKFSESRDVTVRFGGSATTGLGESEVSLKFKRARSAAGALSDVFVESLRYDPLLESLQKIWTKRKYDKYRREYYFVFQTVTAASGTLLFSEDRNNEVVLTHKAGEPVTKIADLASGDFEYVSNTKRTLEIIRTVAHTPLFKAFRFKASWEPEVLG
ncbi:MAG: hypothetical protein ACREAA_10095 [Candidatus Polarisedimenticolia bacterium]